MILQVVLGQPMCPPEGVLRWCHEVLIFSAIYPSPKEKHPWLCHMLRTTQIVRDAHGACMRRMCSRCRQIFTKEISLTSYRLKRMNVVLMKMLWFQILMGTVWRERRWTQQTQVWTQQYHHRHCLEEDNKVTLNNLV